MKHIYCLIFFTLFIIGMNASAQEIVSKNKSWTYAVGVTAYSQNSFVKDEHPIEINLRYKMKEHHVFRVGVPIQSKKARSEEAYPLESFQDKTSLFIPMQYDLRQTVYGVSVGYNYDWQIINKLSFMTGADLGWCRYEKYGDESFVNLFGVQSQQIALDMLKTDYSNTQKAFLLKPFVGLNYSYKCLMAEFVLGYNYSFMKEVLRRDNPEVLVFPSGEIYYHLGEDLKYSSDDKKGMFYCNLSVFLTF